MWLTLLVDSGAQTLLEFPSVDVPRTNMTSSDHTDFAKLLALARSIAALIQRPLQLRGPVDAAAFFEPFARGNYN